MSNSVKYVLFCLFVLIDAGQMYSLEINTHEKINENIALGVFKGFSLDDYLKDELGLKKGSNENINGQEAYTWIRDGGRYEDIPVWYQLYRRSVNHYHNPITDKGFTGFIFGQLFSGESSRDWFQKSLGTQDPGGYYSWYDVRDYFYKGLTLPMKTEREKYFGEMFRGLGQLMHLIQDISVPAHARDDFHVAGYEVWVKNNVNSNTASTFVFDKSLLNTPGSGLAISNLFDTNQYNGTNPEVAVGNRIGLSEYSCANFFSEDTINISAFPYPRINKNTPIVTRPYKGPSGNYDREYFLKNSEGETNGGTGYLLSAVDYYDYWRQNNPGSVIDLPVIPVLDENVYRDYAQLLIPRAVGYSVELLEYFFRGQLKVHQTDKKPNGDIEITIVNLSDDPLVKGDFELYYDTKQGKRVKIKDLSPCSVRDLPKYDGTPKATFRTTFTPPPDFDPEKRDSYMLVYKGQLGKEEGALIGKYEHIQPVIPVMVTYDQNENKIFFKVNPPHVNRYIDLTGFMDNADHLFGVQFVQPVTYDANYGVIAYMRPDTGWDVTYVLKYHVTKEIQNGIEVAYASDTYKQYQFEHAVDSISKDSSSDIAPPAFNLINKFGGPNTRESVTIAGFHFTGSSLKFPILNIVPYLSDGLLQYSFTVPINFSWDIDYNWTDDSEYGSGTDTAIAAVIYAVSYDSLTKWSKPYNAIGYTETYFLGRTNEFINNSHTKLTSVIYIYPEIVNYPITWGAYWPLLWYDAYNFYGAFGLFDTDLSKPTGFGVISDIVAHTQTPEMNTWWYGYLPGRSYLSYFDTTKEVSKYLLDGNLYLSSYLMFEPHGLGTVDRASGMLHFFKIFPSETNPDHSFESLYVIHGTPYKWYDPIPDDLMDLNIYPYGRSTSDFSKELNIAAFYHKLGAVPVCIYKGATAVGGFDPETGEGRYFDRLSLVGKFGEENDLTGETVFKTLSNHYSTDDNYRIVEKTSTFALMVEGEPPFQAFSVNPANGRMNIPINTRITVQLDRPVDGSTIHDTSFYLVETSSGNRVPGNLSLDFEDKVTIFTPSSNLNPNTSYTFTLTTSIKSVDGASLSRGFSGSFTTSTAADSLSPTVTVSPLDGATQVPKNTQIVFNFSKPINPVSLNSSTITVTNNGLQVIGGISLAHANTEAIFSSYFNFLPDSLVNIILSHRVTDLSGNSIVGSGGVGTDFVSAFSTGNEDDLTPPQVMIITPPDGATRIEPNTQVTVAFSEPIDPVKVDASTFIVSIGETRHPGKISLSRQNTLVIFTPDQPFPEQSVVRVTLTTEISDQAGNGMLLPITSTFNVQNGPALYIKYLGPVSLRAGNPVSVEVSNTGDVETVTGMTMKLSDLMGEILYQNTFADKIEAESYKIYSFEIPPQATNGAYALDVEVLDKTGKKTIGSFIIKITGLQAMLQTRTDQEVYLPTETIKGITTISSGSADIENGSLTVSVRKLAGEVSGKFESFLPKEGWLDLQTLAGVAVGVEGFIYVLDYSNHRILKIDGEARTIVTEWGVKGTEDGQFNFPKSIAISPDSFIYVADTENDRIQKFDSNGTFIAKWGSPGTGDGELNSPRSIAAGPDGSIYVADTYNDRIQKFTHNGTFIVKWGSPGKEDRQFDSPEGISIAPDGSIYVVDTNNHRIQKLDSNGDFLLKWGAQGSNDGQFDYPSGIAVRSDGSVYVVDTLNYRVQQFDSSGNFIMAWGSEGTGDGQFSEPSGIAVGPDGYLYVTDYYDKGIQKFDSNGDFIGKWRRGGSEEGQFNSPSGIVIDKEDCAYVLDTWNSRVQKFDTNGNFITKWGSGGVEEGLFDRPMGIAIGPDGLIYVADTYNDRIQKFDSDGNFIVKWGSRGSNDGQFDHPKGVAIGRCGSVYVVDSNNQRIQKFDSSGNFIARWGREGVRAGEFQWPDGVAVATDGSVYVTDRGNARVQKFDSSGNFVLQWGGPGHDTGRFNDPSGVGVGLDGTVYISDTNNHRIQRFDSNGHFIRAWGGSGSREGEFSIPYGVAVGPDATIYVADTGNSRIQRMRGTGEELFQSTTSINQAANTIQDSPTTIGTLNATGKFFLQATLLNSLGQSLAYATHPFNVGTALGVTNINPGSGASNVPINIRITVQFSREVDRATINHTSFSLIEASSGVSIAGEFFFDFNNTTVIFTPDSNLKPNTEYTMGLTTEIKSSDGMALDSVYRGFFTTAGSSDTESPTLTVSPIDGATGIPVNTCIVFSFSEPINPETINDSTVTVSDNGITVSGNIFLNAEKTEATFLPISNFTPNSLIDVILSHTVADLAGNPIVGRDGAGTDFIASFTTANITDFTSEGF